MKKIEIEVWEVDEKLPPEKKALFVSFGGASWHKAHYLRDENRFVSYGRPLPEINYWCELPDLSENL